MFETFRFHFYIEVMRRYSKKGKGAKTDSGKIVMLKKAIRAGCKAMSINGTNIDAYQRSELEDAISLAKNLYRRKILAQMPEADRNLLESFLEFWVRIGVVITSNHSIRQITNVFEIAKNNLNEKDKRFLNFFCKSNFAPAPLRDIIQPFLAGEATQEETEKRLDQCAAKFNKWMSELFF